MFSCLCLQLQVSQCFKITPGAKCVPRSVFIGDETLFFKKVNKWPKKYVWQQSARVKGYWIQDIIWYGVPININGFRGAKSRMLWKGFLERLPLFRSFNDVGFGKLAVFFVQKATGERKILSKNMRSPHDNNWDNHRSSAL